MKNTGLYTKDGLLYCDDLPVADIAEKFGTPLYIYSFKEIENRCKELEAALAPHPHLVCYAVKANSSLALMKNIFSNGFGADIVSIGELQRCRKAGLSPEKIVFSGVGKTKEEISAALNSQILSFNVESLEELDLLAEISSKSGVRAIVSLRINPNIPVKTNPYIATGLYKTKFGIAENQINNAIAKIKKSPSLVLAGLSCHIGSQIKELAPLRQAAKRLVELADRIRKQGTLLEFLDLGGGFAIPYQDESVPSVKEYCQAILPEFKSKPYRLLIEPGRWIVGSAGALVTQVIRVKQTGSKHFVIVDAAMNDLVRPSLYSAYHRILPAVRRPRRKVKCDIVGPICETGDFLALNREISRPDAGDFLVAMDAGAYGMSMASNYNSRVRAAEVSVHGKTTHLIRRRESLDSLWANDIC